MLGRFAFLVLCLWGLTTNARSNQGKPYLFVSYDAGESLALLPVLDLFRKSEVGFEVLALGTSRKFFQDWPEAIDLKETCGVAEEVPGTGWPREKRLAKSSVVNLRKCLAGRAAIVTGDVSGVQLQVLEEAKVAFPKTKRVAYHDSFGFDPRSIGGKFLAVADAVLTPTPEITEQMTTVKQKSNLPVAVELVGQPSILGWLPKDGAEGKAKKLLSQQVKGKLTKKPMAIYVGGYGDGYADAFRLFARVAKATPEVKYFLSLHPKVDGADESKILAEEGVSKLVTVIPKSIKTTDVTPAARFIVTQASTVGVQALFMGVPVIYLDPNPGYSNYFIRHRIGSVQISNVGTYQAYVPQLLAQPRPKVADIFSAAGFSEYCQHVMFARLLRI